MLARPPSSEQLLFQIVGHAEFFAYFAQALKHRWQQRDAVLRALLRCLKFDFTGYVDPLLTSDRRGGFELADESVHVALELANGPKGIDPDRAEKMAAWILIGVERGEGPGQDAAENLYDNCEAVTFMAAAFARAAEWKKPAASLRNFRILRRCRVLVQRPTQRDRFFPGARRAPVFPLPPS